MQAYQFTRPTPFSLKIIHSRVYAQVSMLLPLLLLISLPGHPRMAPHQPLLLHCTLQALTLAALGAVAGIEMYDAAQKGPREKDKHGF